jgi:AraC family transcriptional regulator
MNDLVVYSDRSTRSAASASIRAAHLIKQAMEVFETDCEVARRGLIYASILLGLVEQALAGSAPGAKKPKRGGLADWQASRALAYIEVHLASKMDIDALAKVVALSRSHFFRAFKRCVGLPPMEYVLIRRVERAKTMIRGTEEPLAEVALACGFADQSHFNRRFQDIVGISPGRWRRSNTSRSEPEYRTNERKQTTGRPRGRDFTDVAGHEL